MSHTSCREGHCSRGLTLRAGKADAEQLRFLLLIRKVYGGVHPGLLAATVLLQLRPRHHCTAQDGNQRPPDKQSVMQTETVLEHALVQNQRYGNNDNL